MTAPPNYSQEDQLASTSGATLSTMPQILIIPTPDAIQFQKGNLGVEGETSAIEGEVQIKGTQANDWESITISLQSVEAVLDQSVELGSRILTLFSKEDPSTSFSDIPSSLPFSIPLTADTPQCIHDPSASIVHRLTVTLNSARSSYQPIRKSILVHTRRFSPRAALPISPETLSITEPAKISMQLPRRIFHIGETVPVYVTIAPLDRTTLARKDLLLRNIMAELHRSVNLAAEVEGMPSGIDSGSGTPIPNSYSNLTEKSRVIRSYQPGTSASRSDSITERGTIVARSGASCRFHDAKELKLRLLLHLPSANTGLADSSDSALSDSSPNVVFANFFNTPNPHERTVSLSVPITILPAQASSSELDPSLDVAYHKKHDRPPVKTTRHPQADALPAPHEERKAGPSGAPPPFEEPDEPPPFFPSDAQPSLHPPTFVESQSDLMDISTMNNEEQPSNSQPISTEFSMEGEGSLFGFRAAEQFDGMLSYPVQHSSSPPPHINAELDSMEREVQVAASCEDDEDVSQSADLALPLPPLAMDDPMDPPPTIDVGYLTAPGSTEVVQGQPPPPHSDEDPHPIQRTAQHNPSNVTLQVLSSPAPPPYPVPIDTNEASNSPAGPPPYQSARSS